MFEHLQKKTFNFFIFLFQGSEESEIPRKQASATSNSPQNTTSKESATVLLTQAEQAERRQDHVGAITNYMKITDASLNELGPEKLERCWNKAFDIAVNFIPEKLATVTDMLAERFCAIDKYESAAKIYVRNNELEKAILCLCEGELYSKAKRVLQSLPSSSEKERISQVIHQYETRSEAEKAKSTGNTEKLENIDGEEAVKLSIDRGDWQRALQVCQKHQPNLLPKYLAQFAANELHSTRWKTVAVAYTQYSNKHTIASLANEANFNIYKRVVQLALGDRLDSFYINATEKSTENRSSEWHLLRQFLFLVTNAIRQSSFSGDVNHVYFERSLEAVSLYSVRAVLLHLSQNSNVYKTPVAKISTSLLRFVDLSGIAVDKAYFEAGWLWKSTGKNTDIGTALVLLNHFMDISDAIEEQTVDGLDHSELENTDIPAEFELPASQGVSEEETDKVKSWVLGKSMDANIEQELPVGASGQFDGSLFGRDACCLTGYPLKAGSKDIGSGRHANSEIYGLFQNAAKADEQVAGVLQFLAKWTIDMQ